MLRADLLRPKLAALGLKYAGIAQLVEQLICNQ